MNLSEYQTMDAMPDEPVNVLVQKLMRYKKYKAQARKQGYPDGRWQVWEGWGWKNTEDTPVMWKSARPGKEGAA